MRYNLSIQWHITTNCQNSCKHCYMYDPATYSHERAYPLTLDQKKAVLDQIDEFGDKWGFCFPSVTLMGGDPLLAPDAFPFMEELRRRGKNISLGGNPESLTDENLSRLRELGVKSYQLSLDGLEVTHDAMRAPGSFRRTVEGYARLERYGIQGTTMATLTPLNIDEFFALMEFVYRETRSFSFAFDFVSKVGNSRDLDVRFTPEQVLALSNRYIDTAAAYMAEGLRPTFSFGEKPGAMRLLHMSRGEALAYDDGGDTFPEAGCLIGRRCIGVLSDGTMLSCRRFPEILGRLPEDRLEDILLGNEMLKRYRRPQFWAGCGSCVGWNYCRGCPAVSYGETGDPFSKPATCYAHLLEMDTARIHNPISMDTTYEEEVALIKHSLDHVYYEDIARLPDIPRLVIELFQNREQRQRFLAEPHAWLAQHYPDLAPEDYKFFYYRYNRLSLSNDGEVSQ